MKIEVEQYDMHRMIVLLDAADDALTAAANAEHHREEGKSMLRQITAQDRAKATRLLAAQMKAKYL